MIGFGDVSEGQKFISFFDQLLAIWGTDGKELVVGFVVFFGSVQQLL